jgi:glycosyltransferase involved in cell wall biosynthesis
MCKVSVIVPFYNVEKYIERCAVSLLSQTLKEIEILFIDDASPDGSRAILERVLLSYSENNARIITHPVNKGLPAARNTGLSVASGDYVYHCDSDDWVETDMLEKMHALALEKEADIVYSDFYLTFPGGERYMRNPDFSAAEEMLTKGFLSGKMKFNVWNKLVKRSIYLDNRISFPDGYGMGEDTTMILLAAKSKRVAYLPEAMYHYVRSNPKAFTNTVSDKHLSDFEHNFDRTVTFLEGCHFPEKEKYLRVFKLGLIIPCLTGGRWREAEYWEKRYPDAFHTPLSNTGLGFRTRLIVWLGTKRMYGILKIYNFIVNKLFYGLRFS